MPGPSASVFIKHNLKKNNFSLEDLLDINIENAISSSSGLYPTPPSSSGIYPTPGSISDLPAPELNPNLPPSQSLSANYVPGTNQSKFKSIKGTVIIIPNDLPFEELYINNATL